MDRKWRALLIVCVGIFMLLLDITVVNVALPNIQRELHTSFTDLQWVVDAYALLLATCTLNAGTLGDWLGRKRVFIAGVVVFTLASALCGSATTPLFLNLARGLQGVGGAAMFSVSLAILSQEFHGRERGTAFGIWGATIGLAVAIGPLVGGLLTEYAGWRWIFFVNLPIGAFCVFGALAYLHESRDEQHRGFDLLGFVLLTGGLFALVLALLRGSDWGWGSGTTVGLFAAAVVLLTAFVFSQLNKPEAMFDMALFKKPAFAGAQIIALTISSGGMFALFLYLTLYLQNQLRPLAAAGGAALPAALARVVRRRADRGTPVDAHPGAHPVRRRHVAHRYRAPLDARDHAELALDDAPARLHRRRRRHRRRQRAARIDCGVRRRAAARRHGLGHQHDVPPDRDRDRRRRARRDLPEQAHPRSTG